MTKLFDRQFFRRAMASVRWPFARDKMLEVASSYESDTADLETRPIPRAATSVIYAILVLLLFSFVWSFLGRVDKVVVATGRLVTSSPMAVIQPLETTILVELSVTPGQHVRKGQVLARFEATFPQSDLSRNEESERAYRAQVDRLERELTGGAGAKSGFVNEYQRMQEELESARRSEYASRHAGLRAAVEELVRQRESTINAQRELGKQLDVTRKLVSINEHLEQAGAGTTVAVLESRERTVALELQLRERVDRELETTARLDRARQDLAAFERGWRRELLETLNTSVRDLREAGHAGEKLKLRNRLVTIRAPVDGTVRTVAKRSVGSVLREAEEFITIVPSGSVLEAEVMISPSDVGHINVSDTVVLKYDAFPYNRYGLMRGKIRWVSPDAMTTSDESQRPIFMARVSLDQPMLGGKHPLKPGYTLSAVVIVGRQSILSYLLNPLQVTWKEAMREP